MEDVMSAVADGVQEVAGTAAWSLGQTDFTDLMQLGTSVLIANVVMVALLAVAVGCLLGVVLTQHWRP